MNTGENYSGDLRKASLIIAEHLAGFRWWPVGNGQRALVPERSKLKDIQNADSLYKFVPTYYKDYPAMFEIEERLRAMGLQDVYMLHLTRPGDVGFDFVHASLERRCIAAAKTACHDKGIPFC